MLNLCTTILNNYKGLDLKQNFVINHYMEYGSHDVGCVLFPKINGGVIFNLANYGVNGGKCGLRLLLDGKVLAEFNKNLPCGEVSPLYIFKDVDMSSLLDIKYNGYYKSTLRNDSTNSANIEVGYNAGGYICEFKDPNFGIAIFNTVTSHNYNTGKLNYTYGYSDTKEERELNFPNRWRLVDTYVGKKPYLENVDLSKYSNVGKVSGLSYFSNYRLEATMYYITYMYGNKKTLLDHGNLVYLYYKYTNFKSVNNITYTPFKRSEAC